MPASSKAFFGARSFQQGNIFEGEIDEGIPTSSSELGEIGFLTMAESRHDDHLSLPAEVHRGGPAAHHSVGLGGRPKGGSVTKALPAPPRVHLCRENPEPA
jgi:hypothetical protein